MMTLILFSLFNLDLKNPFHFLIWYVVIMNKWQQVKILPSQTYGILIFGNWWRHQLHLYLPVLRVPCTYFLGLYCLVYPDSLVQYVGHVDHLSSGVH